MASFTPSMEGLLKQIQEYRQKYYLNQFLKGIIFTIAILLSIYLLFSTLEYFGRFNSYVRGAFFFGFLAIFLFSVYEWILRPLINLYGLRLPLSDEEVAKKIGEHFPEIGDKLLNTLQLRSITGSQTDLIEASIKQKSNQLLVVRFAEAIHFNENKKYLKYALYPLALVASILLFYPALLTSPSQRIIHFKKDFSDAPFSFVIQNPNLKGFRNEDFTLLLHLKGEALPNDVYLNQNGTRFKLSTTDHVHFSYVFKNLQRNTTFALEAAGFSSESYQLIVAERPSLLSFDVTLHYPHYLARPAELLANVGNLTIPEGTTIQWNFRTAATQSLGLQFENDPVLYTASKKQAPIFELKRTIRNTSQYHINLKNQESPKTEQISYYLNVIPDKYPQISFENFQDTTLYNFLVLGGTIKDDYGFSQLKLFYSILRENESASRSKTKVSSITIPFNKSTNTQSFYFQWFVDSLQLSTGDKIEYYAQVWDNDGVNGPKSARTEMHRFQVPSKEKLAEENAQSIRETEQQIKKTLKKAQSLEKDIQSLENRIKSNNELDYQEQKQAEDVLRKREELIQEIKSIQEQNQRMNERSQQFQTPNEELQKKLDQLQKIMNDLMNDETNKLYQELKKLMEQKQSERMSRLLEKLRNKEKNTEKEIERTLDLFKKLQMEQKAENLIKDIDQLAEKQESLSEETKKEEQSKKKNSNETEKNDLQKKQEEIKSAFEKIKEELKDLDKTGKELNQSIDTQKDQQDQVSEAIEKSQQQLDQKQNKAASDSQKKAAKSMRSLSSAMNAAMQSAEMSQMKEDIDALRDLLENLIELSFEQEKTMKGFRGVKLQDPRFVQLGQDQLKLKDDARIIEDSLYALAGRVPQIHAFITRELNDMKQYMSESLTSIRDRQLSVITAKQQFAMTSINNLALMLSDVFRQMQQQMAMAMPGKGKGQESSKSPGPSEMQEKLNSKLNEMMKGQKGQGSQSEQLSRMAAEQAQIRKMIQELLDGQKGTELGKKLGNELKEISEKMNQSETDIVNKKINQELIKRNQEIVTRLLESEKAMREQDEDDKRKGETARQLKQRPPAAFEQYIKEKEKQTELLRTIPPTLSPFYKREVDVYFKKYQTRN